MIAILGNKRLFLSLLFGIFYSCTAFSQTVITPSHYANGTILRATHQQNTLMIEIRFEALVDGYSGETIYEKPSQESWQNDFYVDIDGTHYPLSRDSNGKYQAPSSLKLTFCYDTTKNARVGSWRAVFSVPEHTIDKVALSMPNLPLITGIEVNNINM